MFGRRCWAGTKIATITTILMLIILAFCTRYMFIGMTWEKMLHHEFATKMAIVLGGFCFLLAFLAGFADEGNRIRNEKKVAEFAKRYKAGDSFWAIHRSINLDDFYDAKALRNKIFHITIEKFKKQYFVISDEWRPKLWPNRISMDDFIIYDSKEHMLNYIRKGQQLLQDNMKEAIDSV